MVDSSRVKNEEKGGEIPEIDVAVDGWLTLMAESAWCMPYNPPAIRCIRHAMCIGVPMTMR